MSTVLELRESSPPLDIAQDVAQDVAMELLRSRRTIHDFTTQEPPAGLIEEALEVARWAPNHHLTQPWRFYLVGAETREAIARLNGDMVAGKKGAQAGEAKYERWRNIPGWLVVTCENHDDPIRAKEDYAATCCAIHNVALFLWSRGLGVKWTTGAVTRTAQFYDLLWIDEAVESVVGLVWYGYAEHVPVTARKAVSEVLVKLP
ncbi:MAG: nitroreductase [Gammaproteobacteria bacterium]|nr:nitroreductase [Gammaproteobacteria bacterium]